MNLPDNTLLQGGKYKIVRHISSGGFGNTYEGVHTMMDTRVAIKEFFPKVFCNRDENTSHVTVATQSNRELVDKLRKKFNEEAKSVFQMKHENIVRVIDIFEENGTAYYVMDYIEGKSLNDLVKERGCIPEAEAVSYIRQVADALKYVHSLNRLHLDIKPGNVMVDASGHAILIDFGASKHYDMESGENTSTLMGVNTKGYAPIEQSTQSFTSFSPATDIYALGATLYKLLTGITPPDANMLLAEEETLKPMSSNISASTCNAVMSAMALKRKDRPQTIDAFLTLLKSTSNVVDDEGTVCELEEEKRKADEARRKAEEKKRKEAELQKAEEERKKAEAARKAAEDAKRKAEEEAERLRLQQSDSGKWKLFGGLAIAAVIAAIFMFSNGKDSTGNQGSSGTSTNLVNNSVESQRQAEAQSQAETPPMSANDKMMLGSHLFSLQWISWDRFGKVNITKGNDDRTYYVSGKQDGRTCSDEEKGRQNGDFVSINGTLTVVSKTKLIFNGTIITKVYHINNGQECVREGQFTFESTGGRKYWRLQEMTNQCDGCTDYVDIYFKR